MKEAGQRHTTMSYICRCIFCICLSEDAVAVKCTAILNHVLCLFNIRLINQSVPSKIYRLAPAGKKLIGQSSLVIVRLPAH